MSAPVIVATVDGRVTPVHHELTVLGALRYADTLAEALQGAGSVGSVMVEWVEGVREDAHTEHQGVIFDARGVLTYDGFGAPVPSDCLAVLA